MPSTLASSIINRALLINVGAHVLLVIKDRTLRGEFLPGSTGTSQYSTTPMPLPLGALTKRAQKSAAFKALVRSGDATIFTNVRSRRTWIILKGGYKQFRELAGKETDRVTLNWSGKMMRGLKVTNVNTGTGTVTLGWTDAESERIASYHNVTGAGRARKTHKFLGLTAAEVSQLGEYVQQIIKFS